MKANSSTGDEYGMLRRERERRSERKVAIAERERERVVEVVDPLVSRLVGF